MKTEEADVSRYGYDLILFGVLWLTGQGDDLPFRAHSPPNTLLGSHRIVGCGKWNSTQASSVEVGDFTVKTK